MNIFETNKFNFIEKRFGDVTALEMDDFYKYPNELLKFITSHKANFHKSGDKGYNGVHFEDKRHTIENKDFADLKLKMREYFNVASINNDPILTNRFVMEDNEFNKPNTHYWAPHTDDHALACLVYLNTFDCAGTNFYKPFLNDLQGDDKEHVNPWRPKSNFILLGTSQAKFNRICVFKGDNVLHGMALDKTFVKPCKEKRLNQVIFL